jgi:WD40 repeat protein
MINENDLQEIKILKQHTKNVYKVIPLFNELKIASCSKDCTIRIWSNINNLYQQETILSENKEVYALIESKYNKNLLIISCNGYLSFWDVLLCLKLNIIQNIFTKRNNGLIEIENEIIAVSQANPAKIILISSKSYTIIKEIQDINYIRWNSSLSLIYNNSLLYAYDGCFLQISKMNEEYTIVYKTFIDYKELNGSDGLIAIVGKYIISDIGYGGFGVFRYK